MLIDARTVPQNKIVDTDICIVGAGAAGITLARELIGQPFRVCLVESGGLEPDQKTQSLYQGENVGLPYFALEVARLRYFGGATNHWDGWCRPLDDIDFEIREWIPHSGWPFSKLHLDPFYRRAQSVFKLGPFAYHVEHWATQESPALPLAKDRVITTIFHHSAPVRFGKLYRREIESAANISTYLNANIVDIETTAGADMVTRLKVACLPEKTFWVTAKYYILATGGIENARLLLLSNKVQKAGLGNQNDLVGRFFMEHPHLESGLVLLSASDFPLSLYKPFKAKGGRVSGVLSLSPEILRRERLVNVSAILQPRSWSEVSEGVASLRVILRALRDGQIPESFGKHIGNVITDLDDVAVATYRKYAGQRGSPSQLLSLYNRTEQSPNPNSRVTLSDQRDALGKNRARLNWQLSPIDKFSIRRAHEIIGQEFGRASLGRLKITLDENDQTWPDLLVGGAHHMGTTRMHVDSKKGVVDENGRVHGVRNLFVAGSSVFPTSGYANPTLTIVALTLRLADHLKGLLG